MFFRMRNPAPPVVSSPPLTPESMFKILRFAQEGMYHNGPPRYEPKILSGLASSPELMATALTFVQTYQDTPCGDAAGSLAARLLDQIVKADPNRAKIDSLLDSIIERDKINCNVLLIAYKNTLESPRADSTKRISYGYVHHPQYWMEHRDWVHIWCREAKDWSCLREMKEFLATRSPQPGTNDAIRVNLIRKLEDEIAKK